MILNMFLVNLIHCCFTESFLHISAHDGSDSAVVGDPVTGSLLSAQWGEAVRAPVLQGLQVPQEHLPLQPGGARGPRARCGQARGG